MRGFTVVLTGAKTKKYNLYSLSLSIHFVGLCKEDTRKAEGGETGTSTRIQK